MKKFLIHTIIVIVVTYIAFFVLDTIITRNLHHSEALMFRNWNEVMFDTTDYDIVISGNSRARKFYDPRILDSILDCKSYNLGIDGRGITTQVPRYAFYCSYHNKPKCVVQNVDFFTLDPSNKFEREQYMPYITDDVLFEQIRAEDGYSWIDRYVPFVRYIGYRDVIFEGLGMRKNDLVRAPFVYKGYEVIDHYLDPSIKFTIDSLTFLQKERPACVFEDYLRQLREDRVEVVLVYSPIYRGDMSKDASKEEEKMYAYFNGCAEEYDCHVLNYLWDDICADTQYFYNATHVNKKGAEMISTRLAHDLDSLNLFR